MKNARQHVDWKSYAEVYDLMAFHNPAYQEIVNEVSAEVAKWALPEGTTIVDFGAGTGNFSILAAKRHPHCRVLHVESNGQMNDLAHAKGKAQGCNNLVIMEDDVTTAVDQGIAVNAAICIHALYTFADPQAFLNRLFALMDPGAPFILCDVGRTIDVPSWRRFIFRSMKEKIGVLKSIKILIRAMPAIKQNQRIAAMQKSGEYWLRTETELTDCLNDTGFQIESVHTAYRGCSDFVLCRKPL